MIEVHERALWGNSKEKRIIFAGTEIGGVIWNSYI